MKQHFLQSIALSDAKALVLREFTGDVAIEAINVLRSLGRVTAEPVVAHNSSPHYSASAMDGIAVAAASTRGAAPGKPVRLEQNLTFFPVDTGDAMPPGTDAVIMIEHVVLMGSSAYIEQAVAPWQHVRPVGEDIVATDVLLPRYHAITPVDIGAMLAAGVHTVEVLCRQKATIIPTGDELVAPGSSLHPGDIVEFSSSMIANTLQEWGVECAISEPVRDDSSLLRNAVSQAVATSDMVLVIAGSSTGRGDLTSEVLASLGTLLFHGVKIRPGKPTMVAKVGGKPVFGLPGYPVSTHLVLNSLVKPLVFQRSHQAMPLVPTVTGTLARRLVSGFGVDEFVRVQVGHVDGQNIVTPLARGAGVVTSLVRADGLVVVPAHSEGFAEGEGVEVELRRPWPELARTLLCIGSHDLVLDLIADELKVSYGHLMSSSHVGSSAGLLSLRRKFAHLTTTHLLDEETGKYNVGHVERLFHGEDMVLVNVVRRWQGFMVRPEHAGCILTWSDLTKYKFVNRQRGAGTRVLLDYQLKREGVSCELIHGYQREESTHLAVACAVHAGEADVGLGIFSAAKAFGLHFVPLCLEDYDMLLYRKDLSDERVVAVLEVLRSTQFRGKMERLGGYDTDKTGQVVWASHA